MTAKEALLFEIENIVEFGRELTDRIDQAEPDEDVTGLEKDLEAVNQTYHELMAKLEEL